MTFNSSLLVSWQNDEGEDTPDEAVLKERRWDAYITYLDIWNDKHSATESYGQSPLGFDEWLEEEYEEGEDDDE